MKLNTLIGSRRTFPAILATGMFLYTVFLIRPAIYAHHRQEAFLFTSDFVRPFLIRTGGPVLLLGKLFMQFLYRPLPGALVLSAFIALICWLTYRYLRIFSQTPVFPSLSMVPGMFALILLNNYNFPISVHVAMLFLLTASATVPYGNRSVSTYLFRFLVSATGIFYIAGPVYSLFLSLLLLPAGFRFSGRQKWVAVSGTLLPALAVILIAREPFRFFPEEVYFKTFLPSLTFYAYLISPAVLATTILLLPKRPSGNWALRSLPGTTVLLLAIAAHLDCYSADARKVAGSDYYCYHSDVDRTAGMATSLDEYNFAANLNYNLVLGKTGQLSQRTFDFFQISGTRALQPDIEFASELAFISAEFYYEIGFISEARHWAYEALVFYPYSPRALEMLVRVHTILGEYRAAERSLNILRKGMVKRELISTYGPMLKDTTLIAGCSEIMEKRSYIPVQEELNPHIHLRFKELLDANEANRKARDYLLVYYLMDGNLEAFSELYEHDPTEPSGSSSAFNEALLIHRLEQNLPPDTDPAISAATLRRFRKFSALLRPYGEDKTMARNALYWEMGKSYFYYYYFLYPRIIKPELFQQESDEVPV